MFENFEKLPNEKRELIRQICIDEFATYGYENASTNRIIEAAGISKGSLFHYFGNKKNLFLYILDYAIDYYIEMVGRLSEEVTARDIFDRMKVWGLLKIKMVVEAPKMGVLINKSMREIPDGLEKELSERVEKLTDLAKGVYYKDIDTSALKDSVDLVKLVELLAFLREGFAKKYSNYANLSNLNLVDDKFLKEVYEKMIVDFDEYLNLIKWGVYKK